MRINAGENVVRRLTQGIIEEGLENNVALGMVITSGEYSPEAIKAAAKYENDNGIPIELVDGKRFAGLTVDPGLGTVKPGPLDPDRKVTRQKNS